MQRKETINTLYEYNLVQILHQFYTKLIHYYRIEQ